MKQTLSPQDENELAQMVRAAAHDGLSFEITGRGTKKGLGRPAETNAVLDLSALSGIVKYEPDELVITARAATPIVEIDQALRAKQQRLGFEPSDWGPLYGAQANVATIGGVLSADAGGPARLRYGAPRDHLLGYRAVNGAGEIYKAGGHVVKNVTGFDLPKLVCGAMGTLGPLCEVTLRVVPRAAESATLVVRGVEAETGLALLRRVWSSPLEPTGLAYVPGASASAVPELGEIGEGAALIRLDGARAPLADKIALLNPLLDARDADKLEDGGSVFARIGSGHAFAGTDSEIWRAFVPPASAASCAQDLRAPLWFADWAGGVLWIATDDAIDVHAIAARHKGHAILMRASLERRRTSPVFPPEPPARAALSRRVKDAFDPLGLFNPGRMFDGV